MKKTLCYHVENGQYPIKLEQTGVDRFIVTYGLQVEKGLNYGQACSKLGQAILHMLSCEGIVDNRERGEQ